MYNFGIPTHVSGVDALSG